MGCDSRRPSRRFRSLPPSMARMTFRQASSVAALAIILAACGGDASAPDCPAEAPSPLPAQPYAQDPELADRIPDEVAGQQIQVQTVCATVLDVGGLTTSDEMLERVGVEKQDVTIAIGPSPQGGADSVVGVTAWRYAGADEETIRSAFLGLLEEAEIPVEASTIAGKEVHTAVFHVYHVADDTLYSVLGEDDDVEAVIEALP